MARRPLEGRARAQQRRLVERTARGAAGRRAGRAARPQGSDSAGRPARFAGTVKMSARYICSGSPVFSPRRKAGVGVVGVAITSQPAKAASKSRRMSVRTFCAREVVGVVVARREREGAEDDAALHLGAEAAVARLRRTWRCRSAVARRAQAVAHAVVAGEVARGLGGGDEVVGRDGVRQVGKRDLDHAPRPPARARASASRKRGHRLRLDALAEERPGHADAQAVGAAAERARRSRGRARPALRGVERVAAGRGPVQRGPRPRRVRASGPTWSSEDAKATRP